MTEYEAIVADLDKLHKQVKRDRENSVRIGLLLDGRDRLASELTAIIAERDRLSSEFTAMIAERDRLSSEFTAMIAERDRFQAELDAIKQSTTWRITKPLRRLIEFIRQIRQRHLLFVNSALTHLRRRTPAH
jgi:hypothetical protein